MPYALLADVILVLHVAFVGFVLFGGFVVLKWPHARWLHLPAVAWGAFIEFSGWICPLTPLENWLRRQGGAAGYTGDFLGHYFLALLYPEAFTPHIQIILGLVVVAVNAAIYGWLWRCRRL